MACDLKWLEQSIDMTSTAPTLEQMTEKTLLDKGINGATAAHVLETLHTPTNLEYVTFTTGSSAFQNIVGVVEEEIPERISAAKALFSQLKIAQDSHILFTYAPLVNVFSKQALVSCGMEWSFLAHSSRDDLMLSLLRDKPDVVIGESTFIRTTLDFIKKCKLLNELPADLIFICAGTPLDMELLEYQEQLNIYVHDLYGCQEFGWLYLDGVPLREDLSLLPTNQQDEYVEVIVGGLPTGDSFPLVEDEGHYCNRNGKLLTYKRKRSYPELEVVVQATAHLDPGLVEKAARTILRIKSRIVRISPSIECDRQSTELLYVESGTQKVVGEISMTEKLGLFESLVKAQHRYQTSSKSDPTWIKKR